MDAGLLRHVVEIQNYTMSQNSSGDDVKTYGTGADAFATVHAQIITSGGRELYAAQQQFAEANAVIKMRYLAGVTERMRVYHAADGVYYNILNVRTDDVSRREALILTCQTGLSDDA